MGLDEGMAGLTERKRAEWEVRRLTVERDVVIAVADDESGVASLLPDEGCFFGWGTREEEGLVRYVRHGSYYGGQGR